MDYQEKVFVGSVLSIFIIGVTTLFIPSLIEYKRMIAKVCAGFCMFTLISFAVFMSFQRIK